MPNSWRAQFSGTEAFRIRLSNGYFGLGAAIAYVFDLGVSTNAIRIPAHTTAGRPTGADALFSLNTTFSGYEGYVSGGWVRFVHLPDATPTTGDVPSYSGSAWATNAQRAGRDRDGARSG